MMMEKADLLALKLPTSDGVPDNESHPVRAAHGHDVTLQVSGAGLSSV